MRLSVIFPDGLVIKDGEAFKVGLLGPDIHAIQWDGERGEIEKADGNEGFTDLAVIQPYLDLWQAAYDAAHPAPTFQTRKSDKLTQVYAKSGETFDDGFTYDFGKAGVRRLDCRSADDKVNWLLLLIEVRELIAAKVTDDVPLIDADNNIFDAPPEVVEAALIAMRIWGAKSLFAARRVKDAVLAAPDDAALAKIDIDAALAAEAVAEAAQP